jgi:hypothetical protein
MKILYLQAGLGNQMFQFAYLRHLQRRGVGPLAVDASAPSLHRHSGATIRTVFPAVASSVRFLPYLWGRTLHLWSDALKKGLGYNTETEALDGRFEPHQRWLRGYWQMAWPAESCREQLLVDFAFRPLVDPRDLAVARDLASSNSVSIHVRRGDYVREDSFQTLGSCSTMEYYRRALALLEARTESPRYFVFSDDPAAVRRDFAGLREAVFVDHNAAAAGYRDMQLMGLARHHVVANSSFSWWGAWLAERSASRLVIAPRRWFANASDQFNADIAPASWLRV